MKHENSEEKSNMNFSRSDINRCHTTIKKNDNSEHNLDGENKYRSP